jgi:hypothetical protein
MARLAQVGGSGPQVAMEQCEGALVGPRRPFGQSGPMLTMIGDWKAFLKRVTEEEEFRDLREHGCTGRPLGSPAFLDRLESLVGRVLKRQKPGPKPKPRKPRARKNMI